MSVGLFFVTLVCGLITALSIISGLVNAYPQEAVKPLQEKPISDSCLRCICRSVPPCDPQPTCYDSVCGLTYEYWTDAGKPVVQQNDANVHSDQILYRKCADNAKCGNDAAKKYMKMKAEDCNGDGTLDCSDYAAIYLNFGCNSIDKDRMNMKTFNECYKNQPNEPDGIIAYSVIPLNASIIQMIKDEKRKRRNETETSTMGTKVNLPQLPPVEELPQLPPVEELPQLPPEEELPQLPPVEELPQLPPEEELPQLPPVEELPQLPPVEELPQLPPAEKLPPAEEEYVESSQNKMTGQSMTEKNRIGNVKIQPSKALYDVSGDSLSKLFEINRPKSVHITRESETIDIYYK